MKRLLVRNMQFNITAFRYCVVFASSYNSLLGGQAVVVEDSGREPGEIIQDRCQDNETGAH